MSLLRRLATSSAPVRQLALSCLALLIVLASCGREPTAPSGGAARMARGLTFSPVFPSYSLSGNAADLIAFNSVHVVLNRADGTVALDTTIAFPADSNQVTVSFNVKLSPNAPASGEPMTLNLGYLNAAGDVVFRGSAQIVATPSVPGAQPPAPVSVPVVYTGPGSTAINVRLSPRTQSVNMGSQFQVTAVATDAAGQVVGNTPVIWTTLDPTRVTIVNNTVGSGAAIGRGTARIVGQLITGQADTVTVNINAVPATIALVSGSGQSGVVGKATPTVLPQPIIAKVTASDGLPVAGVTVNFAAATGGGSVSPASATTDANGNAQSSWTLGNVAGSQTATATLTGVTGSPVTFTATATAAVATKLALTTSPAAGSTVVVGATVPFVVTALDATDAPVTGFTGAVTLALSGGTAGATLGGTTTVNAVNGVATFTNVSVSKPGTGYVLTASATGLTAVASATFNVNSSGPASIKLVSGGNQTVAPSTTLAPIVVAVVDALGNPVAGAQVDFAAASGSGSVTPAGTSSDANGQATATWTLGSASGTQSMTATVPGLSPLTITATAVSTNNTWAITTQPSASYVAGGPIQVVATLKNSSNNTVTSYTGNATIAIGANPGGASLTGTATVAAVAGVATFNNLSLNKVGTGYTLVVSSTGSTNGTTNAFNVTAAAASVLALQSGNNQTGTLGQQLPQPIIAKVTDSFGNVVAGAPVTFTIASGGGSVTPTSASTNASGLASAQWTLGATGAQTLTVASTGLTGSPITVTATTAAGGTVVSTIVSPKPDTLTAIGATQQMTVQGLNASNQPVAGSWTWLSRNPAIATVSSTGLVTAVANGSTYVLATEAGGTIDSSLTVVQQRIAGINVTPVNRQLYQGSQFQYSAQAVDGNNVALASQPAITWSSTSPQTATVSATGLVQALAIGSTQIRATSGNATGVASLTVKSQITAIDVTYDSTGAPAPDVFTLNALGARRPYRAIARDTLGAVMTGVSFTWTSTNPSVAAVDTAQAARANILAVANGVTAIQASAQGVTGSATLNVSQVLTSIDLQPTVVTVAVNGVAQIIARGKDANGFFIPGGTFSFTSANPLVATVGSSNGVVTGVANGSTSVTATSGNITSNAIAVNVNNSGPSVISFGRDTIGVGRGSALSVPIYLSKPSASNVTVNLSVTDTIAFWSTASVTIPAGQTSVNATLNGHNAGSALLYAIDAASNYAPDTAVVNVQANANLASGSYYLNATDQVSTQVLLSDPSPAGGTYITFTRSNAAAASVSPNPAYIPAGQLAANIVITGLAQGSTTITPTASGVNGSASTVNVSAANLNIPYTQTLLGAGQSDGNMYLQVSQYVNTPLTVTLRSTDTTVATVQSTLTIPQNQYYQYFPINTRVPGVADIIATAPGWRPDTVHVISTTPKVTTCCNSQINSTNPAFNINVYAADSTRNTHNRTSSLAVRVSSSDTTVMQVIDTLVTIPAGTYYTTARIVPVGGGVAYVRTTASGHTADSSRYTVVGPAVQLGWTNSLLGAGQEDQNFYVQIPNAVNSAVVVTLTNSDSTKAAAPQTVTIPAGQYYQYFTMRGKTPGASTFIASAQGYSPDTAITRVSTPKVRFSGGSSVTAFSSTSVNVYTADTVNNVHNRSTPLTVTVRSSDTTVLKIDTTGTIAAQTYYLQNGLQVVAVATGQAWVYVTAPGHNPDSTLWTVQPAKLNLSWSSFNIGARQTRQNTDFYVTIPGSRTTPVTVTLTQKNPSKVVLSATSVIIPANQNYQYFGFGGLATGVDTVIATASGYLPDTGYVRVTTPRLLAYGLPSNATTTNPPVTMTVYVADSTNNQHYAMDTVTVMAVSSDSNVVKPTQKYFKIIKGNYYANPTVQFVGVGTASITYSDSANSGYQPSTTNTVTVTGPSLQIAGGNGMLGMRQQTSAGQYYVYTPNNVATPLTVNLVSTSTRVAKVTQTVTIPAGSYYAYFQIVAQDTIGTIQIQATATGYAGASTNMQVTQPKFIIGTSTTLNTTSQPAGLTVYAADQNGSYHETAENVTVTLASTATGVASIDSATVQIDSGSYYSHTAHWLPGAVGSAQLQATDARSAFYRYTIGTTNVNVQTPVSQLSFSNISLGIGQYSDEYAYVPDYRTSSALTVPLSHASVPRTSTPASVSIPINQYYQYFRVTGTSVGNDTITASPAGHVPSKGVVVVTLGRMDPISGWPTGNLKAGDSVQVTLYARDQNQTVRYVAAATTFTLTPNANIQFVSGGSTSTVITQAVIPADQYSTTFWVKGVSAGAGSATITNANYTTYTNTVTVIP